MNISATAVVFAALFGAYVAVACEPSQAKAYSPIDVWEDRKRGVVCYYMDVTAGPKAISCVKMEAK